MFSIDFNKLIRWFTPEHLRLPITLAWVKTLCFPVTVMYNEFIARRAADLYTMNHDSRVFSIRAVLNDRFDSVSRRIYITDGLNKQRTYIYTRTEAKPIPLGTVTIYTNAEYADTGADFIVWVPNAITLSAQDIIEMTAQVNYYKLATKRFIINRI